jgi:hypothetical protein
METYSVHAGLQLIQHELERQTIRASKETRLLLAARQPLRSEEISPSPVEVESAQRL